jgi:nitrogen fixation NifU-like protein|tara:strand:- start:2572 stop:3012 length:441 start_codon:yes stop_codon:yes gene_type:complete
MNDWNELYLEVILDHNKNPRNNHELENHTHHADGHNPLCGDRVSINIIMDNEIIKEVSFTGSGCAISTASASILTETIKNKKRSEVEKIFKDFHNLVTNKQEIKTKLGKLAIFEGVKKYPARVKCATLSWHALMAALENKKEIITE